MRSLTVLVVRVAGAGKPLLLGDGCESRFRASRTHMALQRPS